MAKNPYHYPTPVRKLSNRIRTERKARGWTRAELARRSGVGITRLKELENEVGRPRIDTGHRIAAAFGFEGVDSLFPMPAALRRIAAANANTEEK